MGDSAATPPHWVGILPAAGAATRLGSPSLPKELLPVAFEHVATGLRPVAVLERALRALADAGVDRAVIVIADHKLELVRVVGEGIGVPVAYVHQSEPRGLCDAVRCALPWCGSRVCLVLPDTWFEPLDAIRALRTPLDEGADLVLGVFPTDHPEELGPVRMEGDRVVQILDKPAATNLRNTWAFAAWGPGFSAFLTTWADPGPIGHAFAAAVEAGLDVRAVWFPEGRFTDVGTARSLRDLVIGWPPP